MTLLTLQRRLERVSPENRIHTLLNRSGALKARMNAAIDGQLPPLSQRVAMAHMRLEAAADKRLTAPQERIARARARLEALNPAAVLERGYAMVMDDTGKGSVVTSADTANQLDHMTLRFRDGSVRVERRK